MRNLLKFVFYRVLCPLLVVIGLDTLFRIFSKHKRLIIMYHGVIRDGQSAINARHVPVDEFERQLIYFKRHFKVLRLREICEMRIKGMQPDKHSIALTFDDGFLNNVTNALPLLRKHQVPATFFISSVSLKDDSYIHPTDYVDLVNFSIVDEISINSKIFKKGKYHLVEKGGSNASIYDYINSLSMPDWEKTFTELRSLYPREIIARKVSDENFKLITSDVLPKLIKEALITIGSHGHSHINLAALPESDIEDQLAMSRRIFEESGVDGLDCLAFPYGHYNEKVLTVSNELRFRYLIAGGSIEAAFQERVFPRIGILNLAGVAYNILSVSRGFRRFGF